MNQIFKSDLRFLGWLALLQLAGELIGLGVLLFFCDWFGGGGELRAYGLAMLPLWVVWGWLTPRAARPGTKRAVGILVLWTVLMGMLTVLLTDYKMLFSMPQQMAGVGLARLVPVHYGSALYFHTVEPAATAAAHMLLPALFALGMYLSQRRAQEP
ncbi:hypothetical protein [Pseudoflavonifractor phocaeensis]|uniref:hypothetical protein n=1 Tax=Pseudoflavonifractor phocaeensis TaxID=1870988 RepID=UPI001F1A9D92|nr:hypothetical protein [Pseudoflavonifractor phocaeensis]MCF2661889.1 hypothetical protein [Pseudoflavonifractor phocaeensis]